MAEAELERLRSIIRDLERQGYGEQTAELQRLREQLKNVTDDHEATTDRLRERLAELQRLREENERLKQECRYEEEPGHFVRCPENHGSNGSLYAEVERLREALVEEQEYGRRLKAALRAALEEKP